MRFVSRIGLVAFLTAGQALAAEQEATASGPLVAALPVSRGLTFGLNLAPLTGGAPIVTLSAELPVHRLKTDWPVAFAVRANISEPVTLSVPPVGAALALVRLESPWVQPYVGSGVGMAWLKRESALRPFPVWGVVAGLRIPLTQRWGARLELTGAPLFNAYAGAVGLEFTP
jgi:hypothetical protein